MSNLTPFDTGARLEPKPWGRAHFNGDDDYGKVDFENDESVTDVTIHVEREEGGALVVHVYQHTDNELRVEVEK